MDEVHLPGWICLKDVDFRDNRQQTADDVGQLSTLNSQLSTLSILTVWGWDARIVHQLRKRGCPEYLLPSEEQLATIRQLSSRQTAVQLLPLLTDKFKSWWCESIEEVETLPTGTKLYKAPWSCSGRGVFPYNRKRIEKIIREQGGIEVEPLYDRVADFAMEFYCEGGEVHFLGYSAMLPASLPVVDNGARTTDGGGILSTAYGGNLVASDEFILSLLTQFVSEEEVLRVRDALIEVLRAHIAPRYTGPLGVDQMIVRNVNYQLHPLVELNLRHTMGHVAIALREKNI